LRYLTVNQQLASQFVECCEQKDIAYIKVEIEQDSFVKTGEGRTGDGDGLDEIFQAAQVLISTIIFNSSPRNVPFSYGDQGACEDKTPAYILIQPESDKWMMIFYCPDNSKVQIVKWILVFCLPDLVGIAGEAAHGVRFLEHST